MKSSIPESVIKEAKGLINLYGNTIKYLGEYKEFDVYQFVFPENIVTGFPFVYLHNESNNEVSEITGFDALDIICKIVRGKSNS